MGERPTIRERVGHILGFSPLHVEPTRPRHDLLLKRATTAARRGAFGSATPRTNRLPYTKLEALYRQEPLLQRGIQKHTGDLVKNGLIVVEPGTTDPAPVNDDFQEWANDSFMWTKVREALVADHIHGDGIVEIEWDDPLEPDQPVPPSAVPVAIHVIDPVGVEFHAFTDADERVRYMLVQRPLGGLTSKKVVLHPDRYHHFRFKTLPGFVHGLSTVEAAYHAAMSKVKGDQGIGELLFNSGTPKVFGAISEGGDPEIEAVTEMLNDPDFVRGYVWHDRLSLTQLNPTAINPEPYYDALRESIAAAIGLPAMFLVGAQAGAVTGSETNLDDYHSDLLQVQVSVLEPFIVRMVTGLTGVEPGDFDIAWEPFPVSPDRQAAALRDQATAFDTLTKHLKPEAAARVVGFALTEDDFKEEAPRPALLPGVVAPAPVEGPQGPDDGDGVADEDGVEA